MAKIMAILFTVVGAGGIIIGLYSIHPGLPIAAFGVCLFLLGIAGISEEF